MAVMVSAVAREITTARYLAVGGGCGLATGSYAIVSRVEEKGHSL